MAEILLSQVGRAAGAALLPGSVNLLGRSISGAALGTLAGGLAGRAIDTALAPPLEGPRIAALQVMESREGAALPTIYGRMRVGGQVIWASRFKESRREQSAGKGGPRYTEYQYSVSFAVAICEGPITRIDRIWANGEALALASLNWRLYLGDEDQAPDPLISAIEGADHTPAYRGVAYIVFEDLPLDAYGNRLPQLSFEVIRAGSDPAKSLKSVISGVNIIPASGEFVYATTPVSARQYPAIETALNVHNATGDADFALSLQQLKGDLPEISQAALTVAWFGDDLRAGECRLRPGVETRTRHTRPLEWSVDAVERATAYLISSTDGAPNYGGTPADTAVIEGIAALKAEGIAVTLSPFILMDIPPGNGRPDPYGDLEQGAFPWRGRITSAADGTPEARQAIAAFVGEDGGFGFRHFILHHARLAVRAGGVETFLIGSEMKGLTHIRDETGAFPFVEALCDLAVEVRAIVGPQTAISYAADWTEYGAYVPADDSQDVLFPMDQLWSAEALDFIGIDWYPPLGDWRDGTDHLDAQAGYESADDPAYLAANLQGGEAFEWYYANRSDRDAQIRTPIQDTAYGEPWIFRQKDLGGWWRATHFPRTGGVQASEPTAWQPEMKPIRLIEIGYPAIDRGGNAPNLFYDPKSSESARPPYSRGFQDDLFQQRALSVAVPFWQQQAGIDAVLVWAWDGRPWPYYPVLEEVWSDGSNWQFGHWLNGRTGLIQLSEVISDLAARAHIQVSTEAMRGYVEGFIVNGQMTLSQALAPLQVAYQIQIRETDSGLHFRHPATYTAAQIESQNWLAQSALQKFSVLEKRPGRLWLSYISSATTYAPALSEARTFEGDLDQAVRIELPLVLGESEALRMAADLLQSHVQSRTYQITLGPESSPLLPGDVIEISEQFWRIDRIEASGLERRMELSLPVRSPVSQRAHTPPNVETLASLPAAPEFVLVDARLSPDTPAEGPLVAASATPWPNLVSVRAGGGLTSLTHRAELAVPAGLGRLESALPLGPSDRWDLATQIEIFLPDQTLSTVDTLSLLNGANQIFIEGEFGWERLAYRCADLIGPDRWRLRHLLRGLMGTPVMTAEIGARMVMADNRLQPALLSRAEFGLPRLWQAGDADAFEYTYMARAEAPFPIGHLRARTVPEGWQVSWTRRGPTLDPSWSFHEAENIGLYRVELWREGTQSASFETVFPERFVGQDEADLIRVAQRGDDNRESRWVSIRLETP